MTGCFRAAQLGGAVPMARVPWNDTIWIQRTLDAGALGLVVPMVNTPDDARAVVANMRYATRGQRSWGSSRVAPYLAGEYREWADEHLTIIVMIETIGAVRQAEEILAVDGVTGCFVGPNDLALSMGLDDDRCRSRHGPRSRDDGRSRRVPECREGRRQALRHRRGSEPTDRRGVPVPRGRERRRVHGGRGARGVRRHQTTRRGCGEPKVRRRSRRTAAPAGKLY